MTNKLPSDAVRLIVFDFDGVLTDNRVLVFGDGTEAVLCSRADGLAFDFLHGTEVRTLIISKETNPVVSARARKLKVEVLQAIDDKATTLRKYCEQAGIELARVMYVGNDLNDLPAMKLVGYPVAVADAHEQVKAVAWRVLATRGGQGVVRETVEDIVDLGPIFGD